MRDSKRHKLPVMLIADCGIAFYTLPPAQIHAQDKHIPFPWAVRLALFENVDHVRATKNETIGGVDVAKLPGSTKDKDLKGKTALLGYHSEVANETKDSEDVIDLTNEDYDVKLAVLADDVASIVVKKILVTDKQGKPVKYGNELTLKVAGGALWNPASYKESDFTLSRGGKYEIKLDYENKFHWVDGAQPEVVGHADVDGVSVFCYKTSELVLKTYDTKHDWSNPSSNADAASKKTGGDVYLKAQEDHPEKGEEIKLWLLLREKFENLNEVANRFGKLTLRTYGKDGWKVPTSAKPLRTMEIDLNIPGLAELAGTKNSELRIRIPAAQ